MPINLISDPWLPVRRLHGERVWVRPADITSELAENPIIALDFPRPDWNAAVTELLIGLLACVLAPEDDGEWAEIWSIPPMPEQLAERLAPLTFAFNLGGDGPRCFQDFDALDGASMLPTRFLFQDGPGESTEDDNRDFFFKRATCKIAAARGIFRPDGDEARRPRSESGMVFLRQNISRIGKRTCLCARR